MQRSWTGTRMGRWTSKSSSFPWQNGLDSSHLTVMTRKNTSRISIFGVLVFVARLSVNIWYGVFEFAREPWECASLYHHLLMIWDITWYGVLVIFFFFCALESFYRHMLTVSELWGACKWTDSLIGLGWQRKKKFKIPCLRSLTCCRHESLCYWINQ